LRCRITGKSQGIAALSAFTASKGRLRTSRCCRFEQMELPVWTESEELRRFVAGYLCVARLRFCHAECQIGEGAFVFIVDRRQEALDAAVADLGPNNARKTVVAPSEIEADRVPL
jgi:hypothetical protein